MPLIHFQLLKLCLVTRLMFDAVAWLIRITQSWINCMTNTNKKVYFLFSPSSHVIVFLLMCFFLLVLFIVVLSYECLFSNIQLHINKTQHNTSMTWLTKCQNFNNLMLVLWGSLFIQVWKFLHSPAINLGHRSLDLMNRYKNLCVLASKLSFPCLTRYNTLLVVLF